MALVRCCGICPQDSNTSSPFPPGAIEEPHKTGHHSLQTHRHCTYPGRAWPLQLTPPIDPTEHRLASSSSHSGKNIEGEQKSSQGFKSSRTLFVNDGTSVYYQGAIFFGPTTTSRACLYHAKSGLRRSRTSAYAKCLTDKGTSCASLERHRGSVRALELVSHNPRCFPWHRAPRRLRTNVRTRRRSPARPGAVGARRGRSLLRKAPVELH